MGGNSGAHRAHFVFRLVLKPHSESCRAQSASNLTVGTYRMLHQNEPLVDDPREERAILEFLQECGWSKDLSLTEILNYNDSDCQSSPAKVADFAR